MSVSETGSMTWKDRLPKVRLETQFEDFKPALNRIEAETEASRCINCYDAPCIQACPTAIDIPRFISRIASGNVKGSAQTILDSNVFGLSCASACPTEVLCEGACVYNSLNKKPILIGRLQRYATEKAYDDGYVFHTPGKATGKRVALIGAGAASLACAYELRKQGHETVVFEKAGIPGGLNTTGIAPYKMKAEVSLREVERVQKMGVEIRYDQELGRNLKLDELLRSYDAVFLGLGLGPDSKLEAPGVDLPSVQGAVEFIAKFKLAPEAEQAALRKLSCVLIIGGGNTALDACREMKKLGIPRVAVSYRRGEEDMSGYAHEFKYARQEGVEFLFHTLPVSFEKSAQGLNITLAQTSIDSKGRVQITDVKTHMAVGLALIATGQSKLENLFQGVQGVSFEKGKVTVDATTGRTGNAKIFAGGDLANGGKEVVNAVAEGMKAARGIHAKLQEGPRNG